MWQTQSQCDPTSYTALSSGRACLVLRVRGWINQSIACTGLLLPSCTHMKTHPNRCTFPVPGQEIDLHGRKPDWQKISLTGITPITSHEINPRPIKTWPIFSTNPHHITPVEWCWHETQPLNMHYKAFPCPRQEQQWEFSLLAFFLNTFCNIWQRSLQILAASIKYLLRGNTPVTVAPKVL